MSELLSSNNLRGFAAELIATFIFIFVAIGALGAAIGAGITLVDPIDGAGLVIIAFGHGIGIALGIIVVGHISGGHLNPAVTIAMVVAGRIGITRAITFIVGQLAGSALAVFLLDQFVWKIDSLGVQGLGVQMADGLVIEVLLTFILVFTVFATVVDKRGRNTWAPLAIGLVVFVDVLVGGPLTGASMNPARTFGPALVHGIWDDHWLYWVGPIVGALVAAVSYVVLFGTKEDQDAMGTIRLGSD